MRDAFLEMVGDGAVLETAHFQNPQTLAWLALALHGLAAKPEVEKICLEKLKQYQIPSGAVVFSTQYPAAFWPTPLALFAWGKRAECQKEVERGVQFLLATTGKHYPNTEPDVVSHDTSLRGWPYIADTHSWTEPTALGLIALAQHGVTEHERCGEARAMLLNRQLPEGGWNSGNVKVYGHVLEPLPESTGIVLEALAGHVEQADVSKSLAYMSKSMEKIRTPLTLGYGIMGLAAWQKRPAGTAQMIAESWQRYEQNYKAQPELFSMVMVASLAEHGLLNFLKA